METAGRLKSRSELPGVAPTSKPPPLPRIELPKMRLSLSNENSPALNEKANTLPRTVSFSSSATASSSGIEPAPTLTRLGAEIDVNHSTDLSNSQSKEMRWFMMGGINPIRIGLAILDQFIPEEIQQRAVQATDDDNNPITIELQSPFNIIMARTLLITILNAFIIMALETTLSFAGFNQAESEKLSPFGLMQITFLTIVLIETFRRFTTGAWSLKTCYTALFQGFAVTSLCSILDGKHFLRVKTFNTAGLLPGLFALFGPKTTFLCLAELAVLNFISFLTSLGRAVPNLDYLMGLDVAYSTLALVVSISLVTSLTEEHRFTEKKLIEALRTKTFFISNISHELRTPLHSMLAAAELLADSPLSSFQAEYVEAIQACGRSLNHTVAQVLDSTRMQKSSIPVPNKKSFNLMELLQDIGDGLAAMAAKKRVRVLVDLRYKDEGTDRIALSHENLPMIGDQGFIRHILMKLASNAIRFSYQGGTVLIRAEVTPIKGDKVPETPWISQNHKTDYFDVSHSLFVKRSSMPTQGSSKQTNFGMQPKPLKGTQQSSMSSSMRSLLQGFSVESSRIPSAKVSFYVEDQGRGIAKEVLPTLFKASANRRDHDLLIDGAGLGLSVCKTLVEAMEGRLKVSSALGEGTCFQFSLVLERSVKQMKKLMAVPLTPNQQFAAQLESSVDKAIDTVLISNGDKQVFTENLHCYIQGWNKEMQLKDHLEWLLPVSNDGTSATLDSDSLSKCCDEFIQKCREKSAYPPIIIINHQFEVVSALFTRLFCELINEPKLTVSLVCFTEMDTLAERTRTIDILSEKLRATLPKNIPAQLLNANGAAETRAMYLSVEVVFIMHPAGRGKIWRALKSVVRDISQQQSLLNTSFPSSPSVIEASEDNKQNTELRKQPSTTSESGYFADSSILFTSPSRVRSRQNSNQPQQQQPLSATAAIDVSESAAEPSVLFAYPVLVVEDNALNRKIITTFLSRKRIAFEAVQNGQLAMDLVRERMEAAFSIWESAGTVANADLPFRLIFMDVQMPVMDGMESTAGIRKLEKEWAQRFFKLRQQCDVRLPGGVPSLIVAMTGLAAQEDKDKAFQAGCDDFLSKPISLKDLESRLEAWNEQVIEKGNQP